MRNIAIVEDEDDAAKQLLSYIDRYAATYSQQYHAVRFHSAEDFLADYKAIYAVVFMDIQMAGINGMDAAEQLRRVDKTVSIIFISNLVQYAQKGYEVDAVSFLVKPVSYFDFSLKFRKALDIYVMNEERSITIKYRGGLARISTDKLMYVEILNHRLIYHLVDDVIERTGVLSDVEQQLHAFGFLRCNKCYLVNLQHTEAVVEDEVIVHGERLRFSRSRKKAFLSELNAYFAGEGK